MARNQDSLHTHSPDTGGRAADCDRECEACRHASGYGASGADYEETYLDWPPRRRKAGANRGDRQPGAIRRLRRLGR